MTNSSDTNRSTDAATLLCFIALFASTTGFAGSREHRYVEIRSDPSSELCISTAKAVAALRAEDYRMLYGKFRSPQTRAKESVQLMGLSFPPLGEKVFKSIDAKGVERTLQEALYLLDIDNDGAQDMITVVSGGFGPAGEGDALEILEDNLYDRPQPIAHEAFMAVRFEIGVPWKLSFIGGGIDFDPAYFIYPFTFERRSYLLIEGNETDEARYLVVELFADMAVVCRCYLKGPEPMQVIKVEAARSG